MPEVEIYKQNRLASSVVGTPGVDQSAGAGFKALSEGARQINADIANADATVTGAALGSLAATGRALAIGISDKIARNQQAKRQQQQYLNDMKVNEEHYNFVQAANRARRELQQEFIDRPEDARQQFSELLENQSRAAREKFRNDLQSQGKLTNSILSAKTSQIDQMDSWALTRQTAQATQLSNKTITQTMQEISDLGGSIHEKLTSYEHTVEQADNLLLQSEPALGAEHVANQRLELHRKSAATFFANLATNRPDDLESRITYIKDARFLLDRSGEAGIQLDAKDKERLQGLFNSLENQYAKDLQDHLAVEELRSDFNVSAYKQTVDQHWNSAPLQQQAIDFAAQQVQSLKLKAEQIDNNADLPESVKNAYTRSLMAEASHLDSLTKAAQANLRHIDTEHKADEREARRQRNEANSAAETLARAQLKENQAGAQLRVNALRESLYVLSQDPEKNMPEIKAKAAELYHYTQKMATAGYLSPSAAHTGAQAALTIATSAATYQRSAPQIFGITLPTLIQPAVKKQKFDKTIDERNAALAEITGASSALMDYHTQDAINQAAGMTLKQQSIYDRWATTIRRAAQEQGWSPRQLSQRLNDARTEVLKGAH